ALSPNIPPFTPKKLLADGVASADEAPAAEPDAEVSFVTCDFLPAGAKGKVTPGVCDLHSLLPRVKPATLLPLDEIATRVRAIASRAAAHGPMLASAEASAAPGLKLS